MHWLQILETNSSGFMTAGKFSSIMSVEWFQTTSLGSYGLDELRWLKPVKPDDTIRVSMEIKDLRRSKSSGSGIATCYFETINQKSEIVMTMSAWILKCRI